MYLLPAGRRNAYNDSHVRLLQSLPKIELERHAIGNAKGKRGLR